MPWLQLIASVFLGIAALVSFVRYAQRPNIGQLAVSILLAVASGIFAYLYWGAANLG